MDASMERILELVREPVFLVSEGQVCWRNRSAKGLLLHNDPISRYLEDGGNLYSLWNREGTLHVPLILDNACYEASVQATAEGDLFVTTRQKEEETEGASIAIQAAISLRRPLMALRSVAEEMYAELNSPQALHLGSEMNRALYQLRRLSDQMFDGGRLLMHRKQAQRIPTDLRAFALELLTQLRPIIEMDGWKLEAVLPHESLRGAVDRDLLEQALLNLLSNALLHTRRGGKVRVELQRHGQFILFHVDDNGEGMAQNSELSEDRSMDPRRGLGFGLQMVREIARLHGGSLTVMGKGPAGGVRASFSIVPESTVLEIKTPRFSVSREAIGERTLVALSDALSSEMFNTDDIQA